MSLGIKSSLMEGLGKIDGQRAMSSKVRGSTSSSTPTAATTSGGTSSR